MTASSATPRATHASPRFDVAPQQQVARRDLRLPAEVARSFEALGTAVSGMDHWGWNVRRVTGTPPDRRTWQLTPKREGAARELWVTATRQPGGAMSAEVVGSADDAHFDFYARGVQDVVDGLFDDPALGYS